MAGKDQQCVRGALASAVIVFHWSHERFTRNYQGVSHAKWLKANHASAPIRPGAVTQPVDVECYASRANESQNAQRTYEQYMALARAEAQIGNMVGAENYYQHAEHYFRLMSSDRRGT